MLVDDAAFMRMMIKKALSSSGYNDFIEAQDGAEAVKKYSEEKPDMVIMDITMPNMDGLQALKKIREGDPNAKVVMCTAMGQESMVVDAIKSGARDFVVKPFRYSDIIVHVNALLRRCYEYDVTNNKQNEKIITQDINSINNKKSIAIIGTRHPTIEGEEAGQYYGEYFAEKGFNIVSGLALGCDTIAHKAALSVKNGTTTAILAHGLHTISPKAHESIAIEIVEKGGVLLSEYFYGSPAFKTNFVERDRLQAGLAIATIVIQTGIKGGTMHAVQTTIDNNKILAAVFYKDQRVNEMENVCGNSYLIRKGALQLREANMLYKFLQSGNQLQYKHDYESQLLF